MYTLYQYKNASDSINIQQGQTLYGIWAPLHAVMSDKAVIYFHKSPEGVKVRDCLVVRDCLGDSAVRESGEVLRNAKVAYVLSTG